MCGRGGRFGSRPFESTLPRSPVRRWRSDRHDKRPVVSSSISHGEGLDNGRLLELRRNKRHPVGDGKDSGGNSQ